jgi:hypothetical protein
VSINYVGHAEQVDAEQVNGDAAKHDVAVGLVHNGEVEALATLFRDIESLEWEARSGKREAGTA